MGSSIWYVSKFFRKGNIFYTTTRKCTGAYQGVRNVSLSEKICVRTKWMIPMKISIKFELIGQSNQAVVTLIFSSVMTLLKVNKLV